MIQCMDMKILVVDDSLAARMMVVSLIKKCGYNQIMEASNGKEAVEQFEENKPDFTFLDLTMPVMDGLEALAIIKTSTPEALVAVLSADIQTKTMEKVGQLGAMEFIKKPISEQRLRSVLEQAEAVMRDQSMERS